MRKIGFCKIPWWTLAKKLRPHLWKVQGERPHQQYCAWLQMRAQANYRGETFDLTFEQYQAVWSQHWDLKGRGVANYCLTRIDQEAGWHMANVICIPRIEHLQRRHRQTGTQQWQHD